MNPLKLLETFLKMRSKRYLLIRLLEVLLGYPLYAFSFLCIRDRNKWLFGTNVGFADNAKYFFLYVNEQKGNIRPIWITSSREDVAKIRKMGFEAYRKYSLNGLYHSLTAYIYIFTYHSKDINFFTSGNARKINLWHGVGIKGGNGGKKGNNFASERNSSFLTRFFLPHLYEKYTMFLSTSDMMDKHFKQMFALNDDVIFDAIYPRCYYMCKPQNEILSFVHKYEPQSVRELIAKISGYSKVFLYMPTWRGNLNDDFIREADFNFEQLNNLLAEQNKFFMFKLHPAVRVLQNVTDGEYSNICFLDKQIDIYPVLPFVDVLITDYSSIYYDFLLLGKEVFLYPFDKEQFIENSNDLAFDYDEYTPGKKVYSMTEFLSVIASNTDFKIDNENKKRILCAFWGKTDKNRPIPLCSR